MASPSPRYASGGDRVARSRQKLRVLGAGHAEIAVARRVLLPKHMWNEFPRQAHRSLHAVANLEREHELIGGALDHLEAWARGSSDPAAGGAIVSLLRDLVDGVHHAKEEGILFDAMDRAGASRETGPIVVMVHEHERLQELLGDLTATFEGSRPWDDERRDQARAYALSYADVLRRHMHHEELVLYPMAEAWLSDATKQEVDERCAAFDQDAQMSDLADRLSRLTGSDGHAG